VGLVGWLKGKDVIPCGKSPLSFRATTRNFSFFLSTEDINAQLLAHQSGAERQKIRNDL
jgi:hypothetical protein